MESKLHYGLRIETLAEQYLLLQAPGKRQVLARNYRCKVGEIDLILEETLPDGGKEWVFVEVRARASGGWVSGIESVTFPKRLRLRRAIDHFLAHAPRASGVRGLRVDLMSWDGQAWQHLKNAWI